MESPSSGGGGAADGDTGSGCTIACCGQTHHWSCRVIVFWLLVLVSLGVGLTGIGLLASSGSTISPKCDSGCYESDCVESGTNATRACTCSTCPGGACDIPCTCASCFGAGSMCVTVCADKPYPTRGVAGLVLACVGGAALLVTLCAGWWFRVA